MFLVCKSQVLVNVCPRLMAGSWMAKTGIKAIIVDKKPSNTPVGHADGLESRTLEILDSFEIGEPIWKQANRTIDLSLWVCAA